MPCLVVLLFLTALAVSPLASAQEADEDAPLKVYVYPPSLEHNAAALEEFLDFAKYDPRRHAELALAVARDLFAGTDYDAAGALLTETAERLQEKGAGETVAAAAIYDAMANLDEVAGDERSRLANLQRARTALIAALGEHHPVTYRAGLRAINAYLETADVRGRSYNPAVPLTRLKDLIREARKHLGPTHPVTLLAELSRASYEVWRGLERRALRSLDGVIGRAKAAGRGDGPEVTLALFLKARIHRARRDQDEMEETIEALRARIPVGSEPALLFEMDDGDTESFVVDSELEYFRQMESADARYTGEERPSSISDSWADVSFCVDHEGRALDVTVLDAKGRRSPEEWRRRVKEAVQARRYAPVANDDAESDPGTGCTPQYERITLTSHSRAIQSRIKARTNLTYIIRNDLFKRAFGGDYLSMVAPPDPADERSAETP